MERERERERERDSVCTCMYIFVQIDALNSVLIQILKTCRLPCCPTAVHVCIL